MEVKLGARKKVRWLNITMDRRIQGESNLWSTAQGQKKINGLDVHVGFE